MEQFMHVLTKLEQATEELSKTSVLIVDSIATFFRGSVHKDDFQNWRRVLTILCNVALHHNVAVVMRFSAVLSEQGNVESFARLCFVANETLQGQGNFLSVRIPSSPDFDTFNFVGMSEERNEIVLELDIEVFEKSVAGSCTHLKMKLRQKPEEGPFLQLELRDRLTVHEIPIKLLKTAYWPKYQRPDLPNSMMGIYFPPVKSVMKVLHSLKNVTNKNITLKVSNSGEMHLKCLVEHADITVYFTNLMNDTMTGTG
ncbi:Hus1-like protein [Cooperia oncophora]